MEGLACVVTGASSGLGERFTRLLAANGAKVLAVARRGDRLAALEEEYENVIGHRADLSDPAERSTVIAEAVRRFGRIDALVNNAGFGVSAPALEEDMTVFRETLEVNVIAAFELARLAARHMLEAGRGSIVNVASILGVVASAPVPNAAYCTSKGALIQMSRELAGQWAGGGVRVNALAPGFFPSEATADAIEDEKWSAYVRRNTPARRLGRADELDGPLLFLVSDASAFYNGQVLTVDGGWTSR